MTVVLHIGTHKTGSTAIQRFAASNRATLRSLGLWYPSYEEVKLFFHYGHHHLAHAIAGVKQKLSPGNARLFVDHVMSQRHEYASVLISAEPIYRYVLPAAGGYWAERKAYIDRLRTFFPTPDVKILVVIRRQDNFARSLYQERVKVTKYEQTFRDFLQDRRPFEYYNHLRLFREAFGEVSVLVYEDLVGQGLIDAFFSHLGVDVSRIAGRPSANRSLPVELVEFKRILNGMPIDPVKLKRIGLLLLEGAERNGAHDRGKVDWMPPEEMAAFCASFAEENERIVKEFLPGRTAPLFPPFAMPHEADRPTVYGGMSLDRFVHFTAEFLV